jgi:hypothetical protein
MVERGLIEEVSDLIDKNQITPENFKHDINYPNSPFLNAYGLLETIKFLISLQEVCPIKDKQKFLLTLKKYDNNPASRKIRKKIDQLTYNYLNEFSISNRQYARRQALWFKNNENYLWLDSQEGEDKLLDKIVNKYLNMSSQEFHDLYDQDENKKVKKEYNSNFGVSDSRNNNFTINPVFSIIKDKNKLKFLIEKSFEAIEKNDLKLREIKNVLNKKSSKQTDNKNIVPSPEKIEKYISLTN